MTEPRPKALAGLLGVVLLFAACAPTTRHQVLTFFFDGVDDASTDAATVTERVNRPAPPAALAAALPLKPVPTPPPVVSTHQPFVEGTCTECHQTARGMEPLAIDARLCDRCHGEQRQREGWNHGPINLGTCIPCHRAHESPYPHLLDRPVPQLCLHCHVDALAIMPNYHQVADLHDCTQCHDPHRMY